MPLSVITAVSASLGIKFTFRGRGVLLSLPVPLAFLHQRICLLGACCVHQEVMADLLGCVVGRLLPLPQTDCIRVRWLQLILKEDLHRAVIQERAIKTTSSNLCCAMLRPTLRKPSFAASRDLALMIQAWSSAFSAAVFAEANTLTENLRWSE